MKRKGSITIYFALVMAVIVPLILAQITSAKVSAGRMQAANSMDQALFSLFGHYYAPLAKEYGLLFLNAGGSGAGPDLEAVISSLIFSSFSPFWRGRFPGALAGRAGLGPKFGLGL